MFWLGIAAAQVGALVSTGTSQPALRQDTFLARPIVRAAEARRAGDGISRSPIYGGSVTYAAYVLRHPVAVRRSNSIAFVTTGTLNYRTPYRLDSPTSLPSTSERTAGVEWLHAGDWSMTAGYASTKPSRTVSQLDAGFGIPSSDVRVAKGLRIAAELLSRDGIAARQSLGLDARLQRVRIQDTSLTQAGEKVGEARLTLVFKRSW